MMHYTIKPSIKSSAYFWAVSTNMIHLKVIGSVYWNVNRKALCKSKLDAGGLQCGDTAQSLQVMFVCKSQHPAMLLPSLPGFLLL